MYSERMLIASFRDRWSPASADSGLAHTGEGRALQDRVGPTARGRHQLAGGDDLVHHAPPVGLRGRHVSTGQDQPHRHFLRDLADEPVYAAVGLKHADPHLGQAKARMLGGDDDVAAQRQFEAAAQRVSVHGGDDRLHQSEALRKPPKPPGLNVIQYGCGSSASSTLRSARAEARSPCPVRMATQAPRRSRTPPRGVQLEVGLVVKSVHHLGTPDRDGRHVAIDLVSDVSEVWHHLNPVVATPCT